MAGECLVTKCSHRFFKFGLFIHGPKWWAKQDTLILSIYVFDQGATVWASFISYGRTFKFKLSLVAIKILQLLSSVTCISFDRMLLSTRVTACWQVLLKCQSQACPESLFSSCNYPSWIFLHFFSERAQLPALKSLDIGECSAYYYLFSVYNAQLNLKVLLISFTSPPFKKSD